MSWYPAPAVHWQARLPPGLLWFVEHSLKRSLADLQEVRVEARDEGPFGGPLLTSLFKQARIATMRLTYTLRFFDGQVTQIPFGEGWWPCLIDDYSDVLHPCEWVHRFLMDAPATETTPNYSRLTHALKVVSRLARRNDDDPLLIAFADRLLAESPEEPHERVPVVRLLCLAPPWTPQQICTAAYHAYMEVHKKEHDL
jgi:hypothetical protein